MDYKAHLDELMQHAIEANNGEASTSVEAFTQEMLATRDFDLLHEHVKDVLRTAGWSRFMAVKPKVVRQRMSLRELTASMVARRAAEKPIITAGRNPDGLNSIVRMEERSLYAKHTVSGKSIADSSLRELRESGAIQTALADILAPMLQDEKMVVGDFVTADEFDTYWEMAERASGISRSEQKARDHRTHTPGLRETFKDV